jgi:hypothetical protein
VEHGASGQVQHDVRERIEIPRKVRLNAPGHASHVRGEGRYLAHGYGATANHALPGFGAVRPGQLQQRNALRRPREGNGTKGRLHHAAVHAA